jgi:hypothetical protein
MKGIVDVGGEFERRLELVRRIAQLNARRARFSRDEEIQFIIAARLFTYAELNAMHGDAVDASNSLAPSGARLAS